MKSSEGADLPENKALKGLFRFQRPKYNAKPTEVDGFRFDSKAEAAFYEVLRDDPAVLHVDVHPIATLAPGDRVKLDFLVWYIDGVVEYVDVKGARKTRAASEFRRIMKRWKHPGAALRAVCRKGRKWVAWS